MREILSLPSTRPPPPQLPSAILKTPEIPSADIKSYTKDEPAYQEYRTRQPEYKRGGFWSWLLGEEPNQTQQYEAYDTSLTSGDTVVTVMVDELHADAVMGIITQHGPHDIHERASGGSETYQTGSTAEPTAQTAQTPGTSGVTDSKQEEVIPLAEEELQVGKRTVDHGTTKIRRYVVRKPVEESVTLCDETVSVERRRPLTQGEAGVPAGAFEERTVEVHQTTEDRREQDRTGRRGSRRPQGGHRTDRNSARRCAPGRGRGAERRRQASCIGEVKREARMFPAPRLPTEGPRTSWASRSPLAPRATNRPGARVSCAVVKSSAGPSVHASAR